MTNQFTAIIERDRGWFVAHCVEIPGVTGRGPTLDDTKARAVLEQVVNLYPKTEPAALAAKRLETP